MGDLSEHFPDDPELDGTDFAHPAWWRGHEYTTDMFCRNVNKILDGKDHGRGSNYEPWGALRRRLLDIVSNRGENDTTI
jgi:hypothetical protein